MVTQIDTGNTIGITRPIDEVNRVVIPMEILKQQNLKSRTVKVYPLKGGLYVEFDTKKTEE